MRENQNEWYLFATNRHPIEETLASSCANISQWVVRFVFSTRQIVDVASTEQQQYCFVTQDRTSLNTDETLSVLNSHSHTHHSNCHKSQQAKSGYVCVCVREIQSDT